MSYGDHSTWHHINKLRWQEDVSDHDAIDFALCVLSLLTNPSIIRYTNLLPEQWSKQYGEPNSTVDHGFDRLASFNVYRLCSLVAPHLEAPLSRASSRQHSVSF